MAAANKELVKKSINKWIEIEEQITALKDQKKQVLSVSRTINTQIKELLSQQEALQEPVIQYMASEDIQSLQLSPTQNLQHKFTQPTKSITKAVIRARIEEYFQHTQPETIEPLYNYIVDPEARKGDPKNKLKMMVKKPKQES